MTEQTPEPTRYDEIQDSYINALQEVVKPSYEPPQNVEYSFPVVGQGISADQYRLMSLGQANGIIHGDNGVLNDSPNSTGYRYYLDGHATDAETNQRNTLILRAGTSAEAILEGFYHRLTQDMELSFPPVTTPTTYRVCLTYDPLEENNPSGPISVQVYANTLPTTNRRVHLVLHTVHREPNQLLSQATTTRYRPYTAGVVSIQHPNQLPDWRSYPAGTLAVLSGGEARGVYVRSNTTGNWMNTIVGEWETVPRYGGWNYNHAFVRRRTGGVDISIFATKESTANRHRVGRLPSQYRPKRVVHVQYSTSRTPFVRTLVINPDGDLSFYADHIEGGWVDINVFVPDHHF